VKAARAKIEPSVGRDTSPFHRNWMNIPPIVHARVAPAAQGHAQVAPAAGKKRAEAGTVKLKIRV
jgi:hypothetical protein